MVGGVGLGDKHAGWMVELPTSGTLFRSTLLCIPLLLCAFFGRNTVYKDNSQIQFANTVYNYNLQRQFTNRSIVLTEIYLNLQNHRFR